MTQKRIKLKTVNNQKLVGDGNISIDGFSGDYDDLTNKPSYTATITNSTNGSYKIGSINISGSSVDIYGKDTNTEYTHPTYNNVAKSTNALYKIKTNSLGHIIEITEATSTDIANLGVEITDTVYTHPSYTSKSSGLYKITVDSTGHISGTSSVTSSDLPSHTHSQYLTSHQDISGKEDKSNKVTSWSSITTDAHYPSEKLTKDTLDTKLSFSELVSYYDKYTDELVIAKGYTITNATELENAIANISEGETLYLKNGTYTLSDAFSLPNCTIYGENATIKEIGLTFGENGNSNINISGITFDGNNVQNMRGFIDIQTITDVHIHNCTFTHKRADWNGENIWISKSDADHSVEIYHCTFTGDNYCNGYGHTKASIAYDGQQGYSTAYNISIHHNTFNHNENVGDSNNLYNGRAICFLYATLNNSIAYCNTYVGSEDTNNGITESQCTD